jgi:hypothetical protein
MTTRAKGITLPVWSNVRFTNGYFEVSSTTDFSSNASYKYSYDGISPITATAPIAAAPQDLNVTGQNASGSFGNVGGAVKLTTGVGSLGNVSGNVIIKDTAGNGGGWNTAHPVLGTYHIWLDATGRLRTKVSVPTSDTDGIVAGFDLTASVVYDPPSLVDGAGTTTTVTVAGAVLGDFAIVSFSLDLQGITVTAYVSTANTVSVRFQNESGGTLDLASGTLRVKVIKQ